MAPEESSRGDAAALASGLTESGMFYQDKPFPMQSGFATGSSLVTSCGEGLTERDENEQAQERSGPSKSEKAANLTDS